MQHSVGGGIKNVWSREKQRKGTISPSGGEKSSHNQAFTTVDGLKKWYALVSAQDLQHLWPILLHIILSYNSLNDRFFFIRIPLDINCGNLFWDYRLWGGWRRWWYTCKFLCVEAVWDEMVSCGYLSWGENLLKPTPQGKVLFPHEPLGKTHQVGAPPYGICSKDCTLSFQRMYNPVSTCKSDKSTSCVSISFH